MIKSPGVCTQSRTSTKRFVAGLGIFLSSQRRRSFSVKCVEAPSTPDIRRFVLKGGRCYCCGGQCDVTRYANAGGNQERGGIFGNLFQLGSHGPFVHRLFGRACAFRRSAVCPDGAESWAFSILFDEYVMLVSFAFLCSLPQPNSAFLYVRRYSTAHHRAPALPTSPLIPSFSRSPPPPSPFPPSLLPLALGTSESEDDGKYDIQDRAGNNVVEHVYDEAKFASIKPDPNFVNKGDEKWQQVRAQWTEKSMNAVRPESDLDDIDVQKVLDCLKYQTQFPKNVQLSSMVEILTVLWEDDV